MFPEFCQFAAVESSNWKAQALDYITLCKDLLVVFYEEVRRDPDGELDRILEFLKAPDHQERRECLRRHPATLHRRDGGRRRPEYCAEARAAIGEAVREVGEALDEYLSVRLPPEYNGDDVDH